MFHKLAWIRISGLGKWILRREKRWLDILMPMDLKKRFGYWKADTEEERLMNLTVRRMINEQPTADVAPIVHGEWMLEAHKEKTNYRWNVTAECSECCNEKIEIWAGFFPDVPDWLARDTALLSAKGVLLSNFCPNCGAKMDGKITE